MNKVKELALLLDEIKALKEQAEMLKAEIRKDLESGKIETYQGKQFKVLRYPKVKLLGETPQERKRFADELVSELINRGKFTALKADLTALKKEINDFDDFVQIEQVESLRLVNTNK